MKIPSPKSSSRCAPFTTKHQTKDHLESPFCTFDPFESFSKLLLDDFDFSLAVQYAIAVHKLKTQRIRTRIRYIISNARVTARAMQEQDCTGNPQRKANPKHVAEICKQLTDYGWASVEIMLLIIRLRYDPDVMNDQNNIVLGFCPDEHQSFVPCRIDTI